MLSKKRQRKYLAGKERQWRHELSVFNDSRDEEALHRLRGEIKKIGALVELTGFVSGKRAGRDFRLLKEMFRQAGKIRDTRGQLCLLEEHGVLSQEYNERQVRQIRIAADKFSRRVKDFQIRGKKAGRLLRADVHAIRSGRVRRWFAVEIIRTGVLLTRSGDDLHLARKKIKALLYIQKILPCGLAAQMSLNTGYLDKLQNAIGNWHDMLVAVSEWPETDADAKERMMRECRNKELAVRLLADEFFQTTHR